MVFDSTGKGEGLRIFIAVSRFNETITEKLLQGALSELVRHGIPAGAIDTAKVPGALEIPLALEVAAASGRYDAMVALGCVIRGETFHFDLVALESSRGASGIGLARQIPIGFGILTVENEEQALSRAGGKYGNKGAEAAQAAVEMVHLTRNIRKA